MGNEIDWNGRERGKRVGGSKTQLGPFERGKFEKNSGRLVQSPIVCQRSNSYRWALWETLDHFIKELFG
jgi:hypothetical protein